MPLAALLVITRGFALRAARRSSSVILCILSNSSFSFSILEGMEEGGDGGGRGWRRKGVEEGGEGGREGRQGERKLEREGGKKKKKRR